MFCMNCGKEIKGNDKFCPYCGGALKQNEANQPLNVTDKKKNKNSIFKKWWFWVGIIAVIIFAFALIGKDSNKNEVIEKLQKFTTVEKTDNIYYFNFDSNWSIKYTDVNEAVDFEERKVYDCFAEYFGVTSFDNEGNFTYDLDENEIRMYVDYESAEGSISIINYSIDDDKFSVMKDANKYNAADDFVEYIKKYGLVETMQRDIAEFENILKDNGLSIEQITDLKYKDIAACIK